MIDAITELLRETGSALLEARERPRDIAFKTGHGDLVTDADRLADERLVSALRKLYPHDAIVSEESGVHAGTSGYTWIVDPLDGTANFASGTPDFGTIIGRLREREPVFGAMYLPAHDAMYVAERGSGAMRGSRRLAVTAETQLASVLIDFAFYFRDDPERMQSELRAFRAIWPHVRGIRSTGCLQCLAQVAEGQLGAFVCHALSIWDIAGPSVILEEAGARVTDIAGRPLDWSYDAATWRRSMNAMGGSPVLHEQISSLLRGASGPEAAERDAAPAGTA